MMNSFVKEIYNCMQAHSSPYRLCMYVCTCISIESM